MTRKIIASVMAFLLLLGPSPVRGYELGWLPVPGAMVSASPDQRPALFQGVKIDAKDPLHFQFLMEEGQTPFSDEETDRSLRYFLTALTVPEKDIWVNLSPAEQGRILPDSLADTELGRDLLGQDYLLKQLSSSRLYPEEPLGKAFWERVYAQAQERFGTTEIPLDVINKVWITPGDILVQEKSGVAVIAKAELKVMVEEDYLVMANTPMPTGGHVAPQQDDLRGYVSPGTLPSERALNVQATEGASRTPSQNSPSQELINTAMRAIIIPELTREVNTGAHFARVRQIYHALILAAWYKRRFHDGALGKAYVDRSKTAGVATEDKALREGIYGLYLEAYKKGVFNFIKEEVGAGLVSARDEGRPQGSPVQSDDVVPRKYFSGGLTLGPDMAQALRIQPVDSAALPATVGKLRAIDVNLQDAAQKPEAYIIDLNRTPDPQQMGNKGRNLQENKALLGNYIPPFEIISASLYSDYRAGKMNVGAVVDAVWPRLEKWLEKNGTLAIRSAGVINMPGILPTDKMVRTRQEVINSIIKIYEAWESPQSQEYLDTLEAQDALNGLVLKGIFASKNEARAVGPSIVIQQEIFADRGPESASGVAESRHLGTGEFFVFGSYGTQMPPERLRNGDWDASTPPRSMGPMMDQEFPSFGQTGGIYQLIRSKMEALERYYGHAVEIEYIIDRGKLFIVQVNSQYIPPSVQGLVNMRLADDGRIARVMVAVQPHTPLRLVGKVKTEAVYETIVSQALGLAQGAVDGTIVFTLEEISRFGGRSPLILVSDDLNQPGLRQALINGKVAGLLTVNGDYYMHDARIARESLIPGISLAEHKGAQIIVEGDARKLSVGGRVFTAGDRLALVAEDSLNAEGNMVHAGRLLVPGQEEPVVASTEVEIPDLDFDEQQLRADVEREFKDAEPLALTAAHAFLKRISKDNTIKGKEAMKLEVATNAIHQLLVDRFKAEGVEVNGAREDVFVPIANGFGDMLFRETEAGGASNVLFVDVKTVDDLPAIYQRMQDMVAKYKGLAPRGIAFLSYPDMVGTDVPLAFTVQFSVPVNWEYENAALWAYVRQARAQVYYQENSYGDGTPGPLLQQLVFQPNPVNASEIRATGYADVLKGTSGVSFTMKFFDGQRRQSLGGVEAEWHTLTIRDFEDYMRNKIVQAAQAYPASQRNAFTSSAAVRKILDTYLEPNRSQAGDLISAERNYFVQEYDLEDLPPSHQVRLADEARVWRWYKQDLGNYYASSGTTGLRTPNKNWARETRAFVRILKRAGVFTGEGAGHRVGHADASDPGGHGLPALFARSFYSWVVFDQPAIDRLSEAIVELSKKYDLSKVVRIDGEGRKLDLEGILILMFLDQGGSEQELMDLVRADRAQDLGGIDLDISGRDLGLGQNAGEAGILPGRVGFEQVRGFVPVIISQKSLMVVTDFIQ